MNQIRPTNKLLNINKLIKLHIYITLECIFLQWLCF